MRFLTTSLLIALTSVWGCGSSDNSDDGTGGSANSGGTGGSANGTGGGSASGGGSATGGNASGGGSATGGADPGVDCVDGDGDSFGPNCSPGPDACDDDPHNWTQFGCDNCPNDDGLHVDCDSNTDAFITRWSCGADKTVSLPLASGGTFDFSVDWGDGVTATVDNTNSLTARDHTYASEGTHVIRITGTISGWNADSSTSGCDLVEITKWGPLAFGDTSGQFRGMSELQIVATDVPDLSETKSLSRMFSGCSKIETIPSLSDWDVSNVTDISHMLSRFDFSDAESAAVRFNGDVSGWDVSNVTNMNGTFAGGRSFNGDLSRWDVSSVTDMAEMFDAAQNFNGDISGWDVSSVTTMAHMFGNRRTSTYTTFNGDISGWDVSSVTDMSRMFGFNRNFNQDISGWDVSSVTDMTGMFRSTGTFNQDISGWNVSNVTSSEWFSLDAVAFERRHSPF